MQPAPSRIARDTHVGQESALSRFDSFTPELKLSRTVPANPIRVGTVRFGRLSVVDDPRVCSTAYAALACTTTRNRPESLLQESEFRKRRL